VIGFGFGTDGDLHRGCSRFRGSSGNSRARSLAYSAAIVGFGIAPAEARAAALAPARPRNQVMPLLLLLIRNRVL